MWFFFINKSSLQFKLTFPASSSRPSCFFLFCADDFQSDFLCADNLKPLFYLIRSPENIVYQLLKVLPSLTSFVLANCKKESSIYNFEILVLALLAKICRIIVNRSNTLIFLFEFYNFSFSYCSAFSKSLSDRYEEFLIYMSSPFAIWVKILMWEENCLPFHVSHLKRGKIIVNKHAIYFIVLLDKLS